MKLQVLMRVKAHDVVTSLCARIEESVKQGTVHTFSSYPMSCYSGTSDWERKCIAEAFKIALSEFIPAQYLVLKTNQKGEARVTFDSSSP